MGIVALHAVAVVAVSQIKPRPAVADNSPPVEVVFVEQNVNAPAPAPPEVKLAEVRPIDVVVPVQDISITEPAPTAITVAPPKATPPVLVSSSSDVPVTVDGVEFVRPLSPHYPQSAKRARVQGTVWVRVLIDHEGHPRDVRVHRSSGSQQLDAAACDSARGALFKPYRENGESRSALVTFPVEFYLTPARSSALSARAQ